MMLNASRSRGRGTQRARLVRFANRARVAVLTACLVSGVSAFGQPQQTPPHLQPRPGTADQRVPLKAFPRDLALNFVALWSPDNLVPSVIGGIATGGVAAADSSVARYFGNNADRFDDFAAFGDWFGKAAVVGPSIGVSLIVSRVTDDVRFQRFTYDLAQGFVLNGGVTTAVKYAVGRERPDASNHLSFPSGHTSTSFMWATVVSRHYGAKAAIPAYVAAVSVGASRLMSNKHFLSDVVAGATIGYLVGLTVSRDPAKQAQRRFRWGVSVPPGGGAAVSIGIRAW